MTLLKDNPVGVEDVAAAGGGASVRAGRFRHSVRPSALRPSAECRLVACTSARDFEAADALGEETYALPPSRF